MRSHLVVLASFFRGSGMENKYIKVLGMNADVSSENNLPTPASMINMYFNGGGSTVMKQI
jgi:hypothetical protein